MKSNLKISVSNAVPLGMIIGIQVFLLYFLDYPQLDNKLLGFFIGVLNSLILPCLFIYLAINEFKKNHNYLEVKDAIALGSIMAVIVALVVFIFSYAFNLIFPDAQELLLQETFNRGGAEMNQLTDEQREMGMNMARKFMNPFVGFGVNLLTYLILHLIYSSILGAIFKQKKPELFM